MKCNARVMFYVAAAMVAAAGSAYFMFEGARATIIASLPLLAVLLCPLSMLFMMKMMNSDDRSCSSAGRAQPADDQASAKREPNADATRNGASVARPINVT